LIHDLVVHGAAEKGVRVADHGGERRIRDGRGPEHSFEAAGGACQEKIAMECIGHEFTSARV
jgi:hypothetical protein